ncbi:MAG: MFS transporter [Rhodospirillaceae bacterium]|jgi:MFS family permease|nr:MFS transporter [Rhodospirillaceae bacterium]MBT6983074.1 MFS transporter [Rhodospirillaceae bacterium]MBT7286426.1 MFS transporter [Rhodospirillaceae bacterium]
MNARRKKPQQLKWAIVLFGFMALSMAFSTRAALSLMMPVWQSELGWSASFVSSVGAAALIVMAIIAPVAGRLLDRKGPRFTLSLGLGAVTTSCFLIASTSSKLVFAIAFGGIGAIGFGIVAVHVVSSAVIYSFDKHQGLATGIASSGSTGGQFIVVPLLAGLLTFASWRWSFTGLGIVCLALLPCILYFMPRGIIRNGDAAAATTEAVSVGQEIRFMLGKPAFHILFWSFLICGFTTAGVIETHFLPFAAYCGFSPIPSATAYGVLSAVNLCGMILAGWLTDRINRPLLLAAIYLLRALSFVLLANVPGAGIETLFLFVVFFGLVDYATVPVTASLMASEVGINVLGLGMGLVAAGHALGGAMGAAFGGYVFSSSGNYGLVWTSSLWLAVGAGLMVLALIKSPTKGADARPS